MNCQSNNLGRLREEIESPFRKVRLFLVPATTLSAALGAFISGTRLIAAYTGVKGYNVDETLQNFLINMGAVIGGAVIYLNDRAAREKDLIRISRAGKLAALRVRVRSESGKEALLPLKAFRKTRRLAICAGGPEVLATAREMAVEGEDALTETGAIVVLVPIRDVRALGPDEITSLRQSAGLPATPPATEEGGEDESTPASLSPCLAEASSLDQWDEWLQAELEQGEEQGLDVARGLTVFVERTGFVKKKMSQIPDWRSLAEETKRRNRPYGMPDFFPDKETAAK